MKQKQPRREKGKYGYYVTDRDQAQMEFDRETEMQNHLSWQLERFHFGIS